MAFMNNIVDEANVKIKEEILNLYNLKSSFINAEDSMLYEDNDPIIFSKYKELLDQNIEEITYNPLFKYKPEYMAYQIYGTSSYDYLILHANGLTSKKQFVESSFLSRKVKYYSKDIIEQIEDDINKMDKKELNELISENFILYKI